jgi:hypothetical protein
MEANMTDPARSGKLVASLWFVASALSVIALAIRYARSGEIAWYLGAAAVFTAAMGLAALKRPTS